MTAVVGVLNKQSIALAADSAVTFSGPGRHKILNRANKLFALSKFHPVGIVLYNSAEFMGTPWETLIKMYRKSLKDQSYKNINEYIDVFSDSYVIMTGLQTNMGCSFTRLDSFVMH